MHKKVTIDFETKSQVDLRKCGIVVYASHSSTDILCMVYNAGKGNILWKRGDDLSIFKDLTDPRNDYVFEAHNALFEYYIFRFIVHERWGLPFLPISRWDCTAARSAALGLPRALENVAEALELQYKKDMEGHRLMLKMCKPRKPKKSEEEEWEAAGRPTLWHESDKDLDRLAEYCEKDVLAEMNLSSSIKGLSTEERQVFLLDAKINERGIPIDIESAEACVRMVEKYKLILKKEFKDITGVSSPQQVMNFSKWLNSRGVDLVDLTKPVVKAALERVKDPKVKRALEIRQSVSLSSIAKIPAMLRMSSAGDRIRGAAMYHGSHTGRWAGRGVQFQNLVRDKVDDPEFALELIRQGDIKGIETFYGDPIATTSKLIRSLVRAPEGKDFVCADFSSVEARVNAWLAGEQWMLDAFSQGIDLYNIAAAKIYHKKVEDVTKEERSKGKISELACGYQGWVGAFQKMASGYGVKITDDEALIIASEYRESHPKIKASWKRANWGAIRAVETGKVITDGGLSWGVWKQWLFCKLPGGRYLAYYRPEVIIKINPQGYEVKTLTYMGYGTYTNKWERIETYGGKLVENIVQAVSRDLLVASMFRAERAGYPIVMHVHDEIVAEVSEDYGSLEEFEKLVGTPPVWAADLPFKAAGWRGKRYRKD